MKKLVFFFAFLPTILFSQIYVDNHDINSDDEVQFCEVFVNCNYRNQVTVAFDYGQKLKRYNPRTTIFDNGKSEVVFNGMIGVMNFMNSNGWEVVGNDNPIREQDGGEYCLFRKRKRIVN